MEDRTAPAISPRRRLLSVIIPAYNAANTLSEQLEALKAQEYDGDWEIVVVNNGSADNTIKVVQEYQRLMPHLHLVHALQKRNRSYARNVGVQEARGDAFLFCDADDIVAPGWVSALAKALEKHDVVAGAIEVNTLTRYTSQQPRLFHSFTKYPHLNFLPFAISCNLAISREAFEAVSGFSEHFPRSQDVDISWRLQLCGYSIHAEPAAVVHQRPRPSLWAWWKRSVSLGEAQVNLYRHYVTHGMPRPSMRKVFRNYKRLIKKIPHLRDAEPHERLIWMEKAGFSFGRVLGSLRYRTLYL